MAIHRQIAAAIVAGIRSGRLAPGDILPGSRDLADTLGVNRKTVITAYDELIAQGRLVPQGRRGTFVAERGTHLAPEGAAALRGRAIPPPPQMRVFDDGVPDTRLLPVAVLARSYRKALVSLSRRNRLTDENALGSEALRRQVSAMLNLDRGLKTTPEHICITRGSQMAIFLTARILVRPADRVAVEDPGYPQARAAFRHAGARLVPIGVDGGGLKVEELERECRREPIRCVYVTPHHQYPTTVPLAPKRKQALIALAERYDFVIVEDDYDHEFQYVKERFLPIAGIAPADRVVYIGTFSKLLSPSLRCGYIAAGTEFIRRAAWEVTQIDRLGDPVTEQAIADMIEAGEVRRHHRKVLGIYRDRRDRAAEQLSRHFGPAARFRLPDGGLAIWVQFAQPFGSASYMAKARGMGVRVLPGRFFSATGIALASTRIGFAHMTTSEIDQGLRLLRQAMDMAGMPLPG